jgi:ribosomal protein S18 acetylase RimI-like enzyme
MHATIQEVQTERPRSRTRNPVQLRTATAADEPFLWEMLYLSIFTTDGSLPQRSILKFPPIAHYVAGWMRPGDFGLIAVGKRSRSPVGAAWVRLFTVDDPGYGFVDGETPELAMAVIGKYRNRGAGTLLLDEIIASARPHYPGISISCDPDNPAKRLYVRFGFEDVDERTMLLKF